MAKFISSIGQITGKLGGVVFKTRGNKTYIAKAPAHIKPTNDPVVKLRRKKFAWVGKFTSAANSSPLIKAIWKPLYPRTLPTFNKIFKMVFGSFQSLDNPGPIKFTPEFGFSLENSSIVFGKSSIFVEVDPLGVNLGIDPAKEISTVAVGILVLSNPSDDNFPEEMFLPVQSAKIPTPIKNQSVFIIQLPSPELYAYELYRTKKAYIVLITLDASGNPIHHSVIIS